MALYHVIVPDVVPFTVRENQITWLFEFRFQLPRLQHRSKLVGYRNSSHTGSTFWRTFFAVNIDATTDVKFVIF